MTLVAWFWRMPFSLSFENYCWVTSRQTFYGKVKTTMRRIKSSSTRSFRVSELSQKPKQGPQDSSKRDSLSHRVPKWLVKKAASAGSRLDILSLFSPKKTSTRDNNLQRFELAIKPILCRSGNSETLIQAENELASLSNSPEMRKPANVWLLISQRMRGMSNRAACVAMLEEFPGDRLCLLNLCASNFCERNYNRKQSNALEDLELLEKYLENHPADLYALLLEAVLVDYFKQRDDIAIAILEKVYLIDNAYTPAISCMAALLKRRGLYDAAEDYAKEVLSLDPTNTQAIAVSKEIGDPFYRTGPVCVSSEPFLWLVYPTEPHFFLYMPYKVQDQDALKSAQI
jgi:tetratricopeptide (TPR) repeat protein